MVIFSLCTMVYLYLKGERGLISPTLIYIHAR